MPRKQSTRRSRKPDNRKRTTRRSTKSDTRRRTARRRSSKPDTRRTAIRRSDRRRSDRRRSARRMEGGMTLFEGLGIDSTKFGNYNQTKELMKERERQALHYAQQEDEFPGLKIQLPHDDDQLMQMVSDELPSPMEYYDGPAGPVQNLDLPRKEELPSPMGPMGEPHEHQGPMRVVERLADDRLSPEALMNILPEFDEEPSSEQPLKPMLKPEESLDIDLEGEAKLAKRALQWEEKTSRVAAKKEKTSRVAAKKEKTSRGAAKKKQSKGKNSEPRVKLTIGKNNSKDGVGTARAKKDKIISDKQNKKKLEESLRRDAEREKRIKAREGRRTGGASSSLSLDSIPLYDLNDLVSPRMRLPQPIQDHQAFDLPEPFSEPMPPNDENDLPEPIQGHQAFDLPDPFPGSISPGDEIGLPMARRGDKSLMGELMKLNSDSSGPSSEKQRLARMKFEKLINEATRRTKKSIKPQNKKYIKPQNKKSIKPKNTIRKLARDIPFSGLNFDPKPTGDNVGRFRLNRSLAMDRLRKKRRNQLENPTIRYKSRKNIADYRERIKGRFVKSDEKVTNQI